MQIGKNRTNWKMESQKQKYQPQNQHTDSQSLSEETSSNASEAFIRVRNAYKIYKQGKIEVVALSGLTCDFNLGEITVIMGPSGCGKTTLLNMIGGLDTLDSGNIFIGDKDITQLTSKKVEMYRKDLIGFVFQFSSLISELTAQENIELPITLTSGMSPKKKQYISELLDIVDLTDRKNHRPDELSGGEQQRVGVAAALANDPDIILCDEPTGELDSLTKVKIMNLLRDVIMQYPNKAMVIVSHDPDMRQIADKLYYIRDGKISHKISNAELEKIKSSASPLGGSNTTSSPGHVDLKEFLIELREIEHLVKSKIDKVEHQLHPL